MRKICVVIASAALAVGLLFFGSYPGNEDGTGKAQAQAATQPDIVFILTDDMRKDDMAYMPKTQALIRQQGMGFRNAFVSNALCCPSRATIMRGQYSHNNGVWSNDNGWHTYKVSGDEADNVATRLGAAGYRTGLFGKYLNGYDGSTVPVGWDDWFGVVTGYDEYHDLAPEYLDYDVNNNGTMRHFGTEPSDYSTDVLSRQTKQFIGASAAQGKPFFAYVTPIAPHTPNSPAARDLNTYSG